MRLRRAVLLAFTLVFAGLTTGCTPAQRMLWVHAHEQQAMSGGPWVCISNAETGGNAAMGPTYWTVFGMVTGIIDDYGTPEERAAVFGGYASLGQQLDIASRFAADHGFGGWGWLTREKCNL